MKLWLAHEPTYVLLLYVPSALRFEYVPSYRAPMP